MAKKSLQVITLGCSKNIVDTEHLLARLEGKYDIIPSDRAESVDYLLINTCGFIGDAKEESVNEILAQTVRKANGEVGELIVFGCLSQRYSNELADLVPEVDKWFGARDLMPIVEYLGGNTDPDWNSHRCLSRKQGSYAFLKISEGCDRRCSYCAIPFIRGAHKSVPIEELVQEATLLAKEGVKELVVIAQDTTYYGLDLYKERALAKLLQALSEVEGIEWIRIHYSYPASFPEDVLDQMANNPKVCRYMDIPLQHIADKVLDNMHRNVTGSWTRELIQKMRSRVPGIVLRTTMIVGHPGETKKEFTQLLDFIGEAKFERLGAFTYSEEEGTSGARNFKDSVRKSTKQKRLEELMAVQREISLGFNQSRVGSEVRVLVDDFVDGVLVCRSEFESPEVDGEILVHCDASQGQKLIGQFIKVRILSADDYDLLAEII